MHRDNGNISRRHVELGNVGWEREAVLREGPRGPGFAHLYDEGLEFKYV